jgi:hypothetical protein
MGGGGCRRGGVVFLCHRSVRLGSKPPLLRPPAAAPRPATGARAHTRTRTLNACVCPVTRMSTPSCRCRMASASWSPHGATWWPWHTPTRKFATCSTCARRRRQRRTQGLLGWARISHGCCERPRHCRARARAHTHTHTHTHTHNTAAPSNLLLHTQRVCVCVLLLFTLHVCESTHPHARTLARSPAALGTQSHQSHPAPCARHHRCPAGTPASTVHHAVCV